MGLGCRLFDEKEEKRKKKKEKKEKKGERVMGREEGDEELMGGTSVR